MSRKIKIGRCFRVYLDIPQRATEDEVMDYIEEAVRGWRGSLHPDEPLFDLEPDRVSVKRHTPKYEDHPCK